MAIRHVAALPEESPIDLNAAIAATEEEVMRDAMGDEPLENDGDRSLEEMGEGLEGEVEEAEGEDDAEGDEDGEEEGETEGEEDAEGDAEAEDEDEPVAARDRQDEREPRGRDQRQGQERERGVPPHRLREATETNRRLQDENTGLRTQLNALSAQVAALARQPAPQQRQEQQQQDQEPDMFADPKGWREWNDRRTEQRAQAIARQITGQAFQENNEQRINASMNEAANGARSFEFGEAYRRLTALDRNDPAARATVGRIVNSPNPGQALLDWFDQNGGEEFREQIFTQLSENFTPNARRGNGTPPQRGRQGHTQNGTARPRVAFEGPRTVRRGPPSLNEAGGSGHERIEDPEMLDNSDGSVFAFATRR